ncbi:ImuA family protein [Labrenzia sp. PHM005]|uniref:ImuA family protein n=1 Tax=Labrenzia sp. PHM005 TaxID=2590016 RepID=UPI0011402EF2|nr:inducible mutagenesis protein A [Labrenzia sp. PHM005]QDG75250.1 inducible mutagenesis protein A [Labrenzia sp. PHM005]
MSSASDHSTSLAELRRRIADLEGRLPFETQFGPAPATAANPQGPDTFSPHVPDTGGEAEAQDRPGTAGQPKVQTYQPDGRCLLGLEALDSLFRPEGGSSGNGLKLGALHELVSAESRNAGALSGFALAVLARILDLRPGPALIVQDVRATQESGHFHGAGLLAFGIDPARLIVVRAKRLDELLWCLEEGASCSALAAVFGEVQGEQRPVGLTASRRIALRSGRSTVPVILLRHGAVEEPTAALTRWQIAPAASRPPEFLEEGPHAGLGAPAWTVNLTRNREGRPGRLTVEWDHARRTFAAPAHSLALDRGSSLRPDPAPLAGQLHTFRPAG